MTVAGSRCRLGLAWVGLSDYSSSIDSGGFVLPIVNCKLQTETISPRFSGLITPREVKLVRLVVVVELRDHQARSGQPVFLNEPTVTVRAH